MSAKTESASWHSDASRLRPGMDALPESVLFSSESLGWRRLNVQRRIRPEGGVTQIPEGMREHVVLVWHGPTRVSSLLGGTRQEANASTGPTQFVPAGMPVSWERRSDFRFTKLSLDSDCVDTLMLDLFDRDPASRPLTPRAMSDDPILRGYAKSLVFHALSDDRTNQLVVDEMVQQLSMHLVLTHGCGVALPGRREQRLLPVHVRSIIDYVEANLGQVIALDTLAALACASKYHFLRRFTLSTGMTPYQFVMHRRIRRAMQLILSDRLTLAEVAHSTGFFDQAHFTRVFRKAVGMTPRVFQRRG